MIYESDGGRSNRGGQKAKDVWMLNECDVNWGMCKFILTGTCW